MNFHRLHKKCFNYNYLSQLDKYVAFHTVPLASKRHIVDRLMFDDRCKEELNYLSMEMANFLKYYADMVIPTLEQRKATFQAQLERYEQESE